jgi:hypothetical protein
MINMRLADITSFPHAESLPQVLISGARLTNHITVVAITRKGIRGVATAVVDVSIVIAHFGFDKRGLVVVEVVSGGKPQVGDLSEVGHN